MTASAVTHATFTLERTYPVDAGRVFAAWAEPAAKARWFAGPDARHRLDFTVGGREMTRGHHGGADLVFDTTYRDIVPNERIVYTSTLASDGQLSTVSLTTVEFRAVDEGTTLTLTEQGTYLDGHEKPSWRETGTGQQLDSLERELAGRR
jgi:uncharacterized protein YndB with AHSA1/START domain